ncbi:MAG: hypothetical protein LBJ24_06440 [Treponema sp.]|jgi:hypothetical protein|nr:hypothetical protein [Treponema sp.]
MDTGRPENHTMARKRRLASLCFLLALACLPSPAEAQEAFLIPQTIFVGDKGRLVVPLGQPFMAAEAFVRSVPEDLPEAADLVITRIELERRSGNLRLIVDLIPYAPGVLPLPALAVPLPGGDALELSGLKVTVASILAPQEASLSSPAPPLPAPGTGLIIYGTAAGILLVLFLGIGLSVWGRRNFAFFWERFRRRRLLRIMARFLRRIEAESLSGKNKSPGEFLSILSGQMREFLSLFTGTDYRPLTAREFLNTPFYPDFLCAFFRRCDRLRFSGGGIELGDLSAALEEIRSFIGILLKAEAARLPAGEAQ